MYVYVILPKLMHMAHVHYAQTRRDLNLAQMIVMWINVHCAINIFNICVLRIVYCTSKHFSYKIRNLAVFVHGDWDRIMNTEKPNYVPDPTIFRQLISAHPLLISRNFVNYESMSSRGFTDIIMIFVVKSYTCYTYRHRTQSCCMQFNK